LNKAWLFFCVIVALSGCERSPPERAALDIQQILGEPASAGFLQALAPRDLQFPQDHGPHFGFRDEWWYVTGNLEDDAGQRFGFQLTFFRHQLRPGTDQNENRWESPQVYMAHFAVTDIDGRHYHFFERFGRPAAAVAGAQTAPFAVWLDDWRLASVGENFAPLQLQAQAGILNLQLQLTQTLAPVAQGERGLSRKSALPGNASYYYSLPRLQTEGTLRDASGHNHRVKGLAWLDREWSTSALGAEQSGWDWFALQLRDGRALMLYRLRRHDGAVDAFSYGALIAADGA
jgi:predicted secreted hydrolase